MQYTIKYSRQFRRQFKKLTRSGRPGLVKKMRETMEMIATGQELSARYFNHKLTGQLNNMWECHVAPNWLLVYLKNQEVLVIEFFAAGTHSQLFE